MSAAENLKDHAAAATIDLAEQGKMSGNGACDSSATKKVDVDDHPLKRQKKTMIDRKLYSDKSSHYLSKYDDNLLHRTVADAGRWAYGTIMVEIWALNEDCTLLTRPEAGWWVDPVYHRECGDDCQICRLTNASREDYVPPLPLTPGEGLPGVLWTETSGNSSAFRRSWFGSQQGHARRRTRSMQDAVQVFSDATSNKKKVIWREVQAIANDPDQPWNPRLQLLASLGLGWVAAVEFSFHDHSGIVVYMAREGVDLGRLQSESNEAYLLAAADLAGAAFALRGPRRQIVAERQSEMKSVLRRVRAKILLIKRQGISLEKFVENNAAKKDQDEEESERPSATLQCGEYVRAIQERVITMFRKTRGGGVQPPPTMSWKETLLTFFGVFVTLLLITRLNIYIVREYGLDYTIVLGPFGALMTLLYGLSAAPASQPRNAMLGQIISLTIAICIGYAVNMELWLRQSLATALAIACMVKLGLTHPPAGAAALIYASGDVRWGNFLFLLVGNVIAIGVACLINNWSTMRQYPSYWGIPQIEGYVGNLKAAEAKKIV